MTAAADIFADSHLTTQNGAVAFENHRRTPVSGIH
jgi:hypothetical protein